MNDRKRHSRILIWTGRLQTNLLRKLRDLDGVDVVEATAEAEAVEELLRSEAFITSSAIWSKALSDAVRKSTQIRWLQLLNAGYDNVVETGIPDHVTLSTIGELGSDVVAEHAVAMLLAVFRQFPYILKYDDGVSDIYGLSKKITSLRDKEVTVFGFGHIGRRITKLLSCFGANVNIVARSSRYDPDLKVRIHSQDELVSVLQSTDALVICAPLTGDTRSAIDKRSFEAMKPGCYVINVSRGAIVDTGALAEYISNGKVAGAALDVTDPEPLEPDHPLKRCADVFITPHIAWAGGGETLQTDVEEYVVGNARNFVADINIRNTVRTNQA